MHLKNRKPVLVNKVFEGFLPKEGPYVRGISIHFRALEFQTRV
jgi:hypothetical protein